jgi:uncharacterized protein YgiM (DUF1202 family)
MFRLVLLLCVGLFLTMVIAGRDHGQTRLGLSGAHDIAALAPLPEPAAAVEAETVPEAARSGTAAPPTRPAEATAVAFSPAPAATVAGLQNGLTLALPLVDPAPAADPAALPAPSADPVAPTGYVIGSNVNVREGPSAGTAVLDRLARGEAVTVLGEGAPGWSLIRIEGDGIEGYIASRYLAATPPDTTLFPAAD